VIVKWADEAWADYRRWHAGNRPVFERINRLVEAEASDPFRGIGKPERCAMISPAAGRGASPRSIGWCTR
jgi:Txe/YoeB family toxin of Txe-Axe toxin-antitoxin module